MDKREALVDTMTAEETVASAEAAEDATLTTQMDHRKHLARLVSYVIGRLDYYENARRELMRLGTWMIPLGGSAVAAAAVASLHALTRTSLFIMGVVVIVAGLRLMHHYIARGNPHYPSDKEEPIGEWYYVGTTQPIPRRGQFGAAARGTYKNALEKLQTDFKAELTRNYQPRIRKGLSDLNYAINGAIEQLMVLHMMRTYKKKCMTEMHRILLTAMNFVVVAFFAGCLFFLFFDLGIIRLIVH